MAKSKRTNNDLQNIHIKLDRVTQTPLKTGGELRYSIRIRRSCSTSGTRRVNLKESQKAINWVKSNIIKVCFCPQKRMSPPGPTNCSQR